MTLESRATALTERLERNKKRREYLGRIRDFRTRRETFDSALAEIGRLEKPYEALRKTGIVASISLPTADGFAEYLKALANEFEADRSYVVDSERFAIGRFQNGVKRIRDGLEQALDDAWKKHLDAIRPSLDRALLDTLAKMPDYRPIVEQIDRHIRQFDHLGRGLPTSASDIRELANLAGEANRVWNEELKGGSIPDSVLKFIRESSSPDGAGLHLLTPAVRKFLRDEGLETSFCIRPASPGGRP